MVPAMQTFALCLQEEFNKRKSRNSGYSVRSFAKQLGISSSYLSKLMNGKKSVSEETFFKIASRLKFEENIIDDLHASLPQFKMQRLDFNEIVVDEFQFIADWYHYAILEAVTLADFKPQATWFAQRLNLPLAKVEAALERLKRLGYLKTNAKGEVLNLVENHTTAHLASPGSACREHERQLLDLAIHSLDDVAIENRDQSSLTLAIPSSRIKEAREKINTFRREMAALLQRKGKRDSIYHLSVSFYPVTEIKQIHKIPRSIK